VRALGRTHRHPGQYRDHEPGDPAPGVDPKKRMLGATERDERRRQMWHCIVRNIDARRLVFVDESGTNVTLARRYGWAPRGDRSRGSVPRNYGTNLTLFASLSLSGIGSAMVLDGAADSISFQLYVEQILVPTLVPRQLVIMDNLSVHKQAPIRHAIEAAGCRVLFLPSYSPDMSPIEEAFSKIKAILRRVEARTREALEAAIAQAIDLVTTADAHGFFRHCGYLVQ
jgi:transposase